MNETEKLIEALRNGILRTEDWRSKGASRKFVHKEEEAAKAALLAHVERLERTNKWLPDIAAREGLLRINRDLRAENERLKAHEYGHGVARRAPMSVKAMLTP